MLPCHLECKTYKIFKKGYTLNKEEYYLPTSNKIEYRLGEKSP
jgi:hypothetical protein